MKKIVMALLLFLTPPIKASEAIGAVKLIAGYRILSHGENIIRNNYGNFFLALAVWYESLPTKKDRFLSAIIKEFTQKEAETDIQKYGKAVATGTGLMIAGIWFMKSGIQNIKA